MQIATMSLVGNFHLLSYRALSSKRVRSRQFIALVERRGELVTMDIHANAFYPYGAQYCRRACGDWLRQEDVTWAKRFCRDETLGGAAPASACVFSGYRLSEHFAIPNQLSTYLLTLARLKRIVSLRRRNG